MFDLGNKRVSMRGSSAGASSSRQTAQSLTETARIERERRAQDRLREKSALAIQRRVRGLLTRQKQRGEFRQEFAQRMQDVRRVEQTLVSLGKLPQQQRFLAGQMALPLLRMALFVGSGDEVVQGVLLLANRANLPVFTGGGEDKDADTATTSLYAYAVARFLLRSAGGGDVIGIVRAMLTRLDASSPYFARLVKDAVLRAVVDSQWTDVAVGVLNCAAAAAAQAQAEVELGEAFWLASQVDGGRAAAAAVFARCSPSTLRALWRSLAQHTPGLASSSSSSRHSGGLFGPSPRIPSAAATNQQRTREENSAVFTSLAHMAGTLSALDDGDDEAAAVGMYIQASQSYFADYRLVAAAPTGDAVLVEFRSAMRFPCAWPFLNALHEYASSVATTTTQQLLCADPAVLQRMWTSLDNAASAAASSSSTLEYACKSTLRFINLADDVELFQQHQGGLQFATVVGTLKRHLLEQSLASSSSSSSLSTLFCALFERWSRRDEEEGAAFSSSSDASSSMWLFPPQANLTSVRSRDLLLRVPMVFPFDQRVRHFQDTLHNSLPSANHEFAYEIDPALFVHCRLHRDNLLEEAYQQLRQFDFATARQRLKITFVSPLGLEEAGIGQGVFKEFLTQFCAQAFAKDTGLFASTSRGGFYPCSLSRANLPKYEFIGRVLGKAVCDGVLIEAQLSPFVINLMLGRRNQVHDLQFLDAEFYRQLLSLKRLAPQALNELDLGFSTWSALAKREVLLVQEELRVTALNVDAYIALLCDFKLNQELAEPVAALASGFASALHELADVCRMFTSKEFATVIGGSRRFVVSELRANVQYAGGYHASQDIIQNFWSVVEHDLTPVQQSKLLRFITSCSRPPLAGFAQLDPKVTIYQVRGEEDRLPTSATCVNLLKLPNYASRQVLRDKLLLAIESDSGFELS